MQRLLLHKNALVRGVLPGDDASSALHGLCMDNGFTIINSCALEVSASWLLSAAVQRSPLLTAGVRLLFFFLLHDFVLPGPSS